MVIFEKVANKIEGIISLAGTGTVSNRGVKIEEIISLVVGTASNRCSNGRYYFSRYNKHDIGAWWRFELLFGWHRIDKIARRERNDK